MTRHPLAIVGAWLATVSAFVLLFVLFVDLLGLHHNPYFGLLFFVVLPVFFVLGLVLIPIGMVLERRRRQRGLAPRRWPRIDLNDPVHRRGVVIVLALTVVNLLIVSLAAYRSVEYMDSTSFCGQVCHTVMQPEFVAHNDGPHAQVPCVDCHVGSATGAFLRAKIAGTRQLVALARGTYSRPIPAPVHNLRPARETCETGHTAAKFQGDKVRVVEGFASDEQNTPMPTRLLMHVGGGIPELGMGSGIHWHANPSNEIDFFSPDDKRETIPYVRLKGADGKVHEYRTADGKAQPPAGAELRRMDCIDCHNRPTHQFFASPERAVDAALTRRAIATTMPFARQQAIEALNAAGNDRDGAPDVIAKHLRDFYAAKYASAVPATSPDLDQLVRTTQYLHARTVFPAMNVSWGTHQDHLGHTDSPGCFRCHDDEHKSADGRVIKQDCDLCHEMQ